ncbi:MAG TPA: hypothetical protein VNO30_02380 [Kofleriaceae bacterium]|nr:hypothetical protein [Kofleriaceae bacterium]
MDASLLIGLLLFAWTMWAVLFWGSIAALERHNPFNTFGWALVWSAVEIAASAGMAGAGFAGYGILIAWLVFLFRLLLGRYELGVLHAIGVVIVTVVGPYFVADAFFSFVGSSETLLIVALYAVPLGVLVAWRWPRPAPAQPTNLPPARLARLWRKEAKPAPAPAPTSAPAPAKISAAPAPAPAPAPIAPPPAPPPRADGEPSFLR